MRGHPTRRRLGFAIAVLLTATIAGSLAHAQESSPLVYDDGRFRAQFGIRAGLGYVATADTNFGAGFEGDDNVDYGEGFIQPRLDLSLNTGAGQLSGAASVIGAATRSDGDPGGFTSDNPEDVDLEHLFLGWSSGSLFPALGDDAVSLSVGRQDFRIGDGFIIWDGNFDTGKDATYWLAPRTAFSQTALASLNIEPVHGDVFYLKGDHDQDDSELAGLNLEVNTGSFGTIGGTYFNIIDSDEQLLVRDDMDVVSLRVSDLPVPFIENLTLRGEYVDQSGGEETEIDAYA